MAPRDLKGRPTSSGLSCARWTWGHCVAHTVEGRLAGSVRGSRMKARSPKSGTNARFRTPSPNHLALTPPPSPSPRQPPWRNHPRSPASNSAGRYVASCRAKSRRRTAGTRAGGSLTFIRSRLKNSKVRYFDDHRIKINQEKCA